MSAFRSFSNVVLRFVKTIDMLIVVFPHVMPGNEKYTNLIQWHARMTFKAKVETEKRFYKRYTLCFLWPTKNSSDVDRIKSINKLL